MANETQNTGQNVATQQRGDMQRSTPRWTSPFEEMERLFGEVFPGHWTAPLRRNWPMGSDLAPGANMPFVDVVDRDEDVVLKAEMPGVNKDDIDVSLSDDTVTIKGSTRQEQNHEEGNYYRREIASGSFARRVVLPAPVDGENAKAEFKDGLLEMTLPKREASKTQRITVQ
mgnify:CR=1 FL=1